MPVSVQIALCLALLFMALGGAASIYFVCGLVDKVTKLRVSNDEYQYKRLQHADEVRGITKSMETEKLSGATGNDGTLTPDALQHLGELI